jgi:Na+/H+ antiporter NhaD/arsenite permease-like protein
MLKRFLPPALLLSLFTAPGMVFASGASSSLNLHLTSSSYGIISLVIFFVAYLLVIGEEYLHLRKSKPVMFAAGLLWIIVAVAGGAMGKSNEVHSMINHNILEYANLLLFLLVAMTYVNALIERNVFVALRGWLLKKGFSYRTLFWITGWIGFFLSPIADNLTAALILCAVILSVAKGNKKVIAIGCVNIVVAVNAGGAFSPFGDITTLMVWQKNILSFFQFFQIFIPSVVNYIIPAFIMSFAVPKEVPVAIDEDCRMKEGAVTAIFLFLMTIVTAVSFHTFLHLPPTVGMLFGLSFLQFFGFFIRRKQRIAAAATGEATMQTNFFDFFRKIANVEWDTLLFFYGVIMCVGALSVLGYLATVSHYFYDQLGTGLPAIHHATPANILVGFASAIVDNIPVMFAVLTMHPVMSEGQWLLVTLTAGVGGSLLSVGSAAGVALMGQSQGNYTFFSHLKWTWAIFLGYAASIAVHLWLNAGTFHIPV